MKIKTGLEADFAAYKDLNSKDSYSARCVSYAEDVANLFEKKIPENASEPEVMRIIVDNFKSITNEADYDGITGFMYGAAIATLSRYWVHGEPLRRFHNKETQFGTEGDEANETGGVLNPALLNIRI